MMMQFIQSLFKYYGINENYIFQKRTPFFHYTGNQEVIEISRYSDIFRMQLRNGEGDQEK